MPAAGLQARFLKASADTILLASLIACSDGNPPVAAPTAEPSIQAVTVHELRPQTWQGTINAFGVIEALEEVNIAAELSGTVKATHVNEGDRVDAGQLLLELDPEKRQLAVQQARQQLNESRARMEEARLRLQRRRNLAEKETISKEVLDNAQLAVDSANASYQQSAASLQLAERELADTRIVSPTAGLIDVRAVETGESVAAGSTLITLQAMQSLRMQTWVSEANIANVRAGGQAVVTASGLAGRQYQATIEWVGVNADSATGNFPVKLILTDSSDSLRPGMTAAAALNSISIPDALLLPESALIDRNRRRVVFVIEPADTDTVASEQTVKHGIARIREPLLAAGFANRLLVIEGLVVGDQIVTEGQESLLDGTPVTVRTRD